MQLPPLAIALSLSLGGLARLASAQDATKPPATEFTGDVSFVNVSGNTSITTLNVGERFIRRMARWEFRQDFGVVYGKTERTETSNLLLAALRADYVLGARWAIYGRTAFERNRFAGIESRFAEGVGAVYKVIATEIDQINVEAGFQVTQQRNLDGTNDTFNSLRGATSWKHAFGRGAYFLQSAEILPNLDNSKDLLVNSETAVVAPLSSHIGIKLSYLVRFDNLPALNATGTAPLKKTDTILASGVQISF